MRKLCVNAAVALWRRQIQTIINVANQLQRTGKTGASTGELIAAAFVLNRMDYLPASYSDVIEA